MLTAAATSAGIPAAPRDAEIRSPTMSAMAAAPRLGIGHACEESMRANVPTPSGPERIRPAVGGPLANLGIQDHDILQLGVWPEAPLRVNRRMIEALPDFVLTLRRLGVLDPDEPFRGEQLTGGVSSDIWRIETRRGSVCAKRALAKLKTSADWFAPVERNAYEAAWFETVGEFLPEAVPPIRARDADAGLFVMDFLDPARFRPWKEELRLGRVHASDAAAVGERLATIHAQTAGAPSVASRFASDALFHALRIEPYLEATARAHPDRAEALLDLAQTTAATRKALVHGDVSPKNILLGPNGPVFLDAECAWYGDPAFDLAFCLNHLLLKSVWVPEAAAALAAAYTALAASYFAGVTWEAPDDCERRAAHLLPGLLLARIDGKSPVEYIVTERERDRVRTTARRLLAEPVSRLEAVADAWERDRPA